MKKIENYLQKYNQDFLEILNINKDIQRKIIKLIKIEYIDYIGTFVFPTLV